MKFSRFLTLLVSSATLVSVAHAGGRPATAPAIPSYLITNDDLPPKTAMSGTAFAIAADGTLGTSTRVSLGGVGSGGGYFAANRVSILSNSTSACAFLSLAGSAEIAGVDLNTLQDVANVAASSTDSGIDNGAGMVNNGANLYVSFSTSSTIATFTILPGCGLQFVSDIAPVGLHLGNTKGMAIHGNLLIVSYGDGSIQSFNVSGGTPVSNGDLQNATGYSTDQYPSGIDITQDGHFAIFGDASNSSVVEVSDISSGKLTKTVLYTAGAAPNSNNVLLSPDETLIYISNNSTGKVTAAFFDQTTGKVTPGCTSATLKGFDNKWIWLSTPVTQLNTGTGSVLYLAEFGSSIGVVNVTSSGGSCTLTEATGSPVSDPNSTSLLSIGVYPPRTF